jgi:flagellar motor switch protein FliN/FliY
MPDENSGNDNFNENTDSDQISWDDLSGETEKEIKGENEKNMGVNPSESYETKKSAEFSELKKSNIVTDSKNIDFILDIPLEVTVELGRTTMPIYDLLQLGQGSIVELNKLAGEPLEILVNQKLIAKGEVVVVNGKFGIRLTDIISPRERVENLT